MDSPSMKVNENFPLSSLGGSLASLTSSRTCGSSSNITMPPLCMEPWMTSSLAASQLTSLPGFLATTSVYPGFMAAAAAAAAGGNAPAAVVGAGSHGLAAFNLSALTSLTSQTPPPPPPCSRPVSPPPPAANIDYSSPLLHDDNDAKSTRIVASLRLKAREHMETLGMTIAGQ